jgi:hypothetical protein
MERQLDSSKIPRSPVSCAAVEESPARRPATQAKLQSHDAESSALGTVGESRFSNQSFDSGCRPQTSQLEKREGHY